MPRYPEYPDRFNNLLRTKEEEEAMALAENAQATSPYGQYDFLARDLPNVGDHVFDFGTSGRNYEETRKTRDLYHGEIKGKTDEHGNLKEAEIQGSIGSSRAGAHGQVKVDVPNSKTGIDVGATAGIAGFSTGGIFTKQADRIQAESGHLDLNVGNSVAGVGGKATFSQEQGISLEGSLNVPMAELKTREVESEIPNTETFVTTFSFGIPTLAQEIDEYSKVVTASGHPLHRPGKETPIYEQLTKLTVVGNVVQSKVVKATKPKLNGGKRWETILDAATPGYIEFQQEISDFLGSLQSDVQQNYHDQIRSNVQDRLKDFGYHGPREDVVSAAVRASINRHADRLENPQTGLATAISIAEGVVGFFGSKAAGYQKAGVDYPGNTGGLVKARTPAGEKARIAQAVDLVVKQNLPAAPDHKYMTASQRKAARHGKGAVADMSMGVDTLQTGGPIRTAVERYLSRFDSKTNNRAEAMNYALEGLIEAKSYPGPSQDLSPEDRSYGQQVIRDYVDGLGVVENRIDGHATTSTAPFRLRERQERKAREQTAAKAEEVALQERLAQVLGDAKTAQSVWQGTTRERASTRNYPAKAKEAMDWVDRMLNGKSTSLPHSKSANMSYASTPELAGVLMDRPAVNRMMTTPAYNNRTDSQHKSAVTAVKSHFGAVYADNKPDVPNRNTVAEEPSRVVDWGISVQKETDRRQAEQQRQEQQAANVRAKAKQVASVQHAKAVAREEAGLPALDNLRNVDVAKVDKLGENAISKAQAAEEGVSYAQSAQPAISKDVLGAAWGVANLTRQVSARRHNQSSDQEAAPSRAPGAESLYENPEKTSGSLGSAGYTDASGRYHSGTNRSGISTGGSHVDEYGREVGAYGQFTRDVMGRGDGSASAGNTRVICTELVRQGLMAPSLQRLDIAFTLKRLSPATVRGYHAWAVPYVRLMKRSSIAVRLIEPIARWRAEEIAYQLGEREEPNWAGKAVRLVMEPSCWMLGTVLGWLGDPDRFAAKISDL